MAIVYIHRRKDIEDPFLNVFYVGIGVHKKRAYQKYSYSRNALWFNVINKINYEIEITHNDILYEEACAIERYLIAFYGRKDLKLGNLCNMTDGGTGILNFILSDAARKSKSEKMSGANNPFFGKKHKEGTFANVPKRGKISDITRQKMIDAKKIYHPIRGKFGQNHPSYGSKRSDETRKNISEAKKGKKHSEESKKNMSIGQRNRTKYYYGIDNGNYGRKNSAETRKKISEGNKNKISPKIGIKLSEEHKIKISESLKGKIHSLESRIKMSESKKGEKNPMYIKKMKKYENNLFNAPQLNGGDASVCTKKNTSNI
jgi:hypothetical protein